MILPAVIAGFDVSRVFIDGGSSLNLMFVDTLRKMNISLSNLKPTDMRFHDIKPEKPNYPQGKIDLDVQFMAVPHYTYLLWRNPGPKGPITVKGSFALANKCDKDIHKMSETFGMQAEYAASRLTTDYDVLPGGGRTLKEKTFDTSKNSKEVQIHPIDPKKMTAIATNMDSA
ncbi:uncharacterized protein [Lolium perenne]|uniref:uncharacterized protein n=1 Tax=Lolium perenne TaxID=4522 RepID=UPI003A9A1D43